MTAPAKTPTKPTELTMAFAFFSYTVAAVAMQCSLLSLSARGLHHALSDDAWLDPRGECRIHASRLTQRCKREKLDPKAMWNELAESTLWVRDGDDLIAVWLLPERARCMRKYEQAVAAAARSVALRRQRAQQGAGGAKKPPRSRKGAGQAAPAPDAPKPLSPQDLNDRSTVDGREMRANDGLTSFAAAASKVMSANGLSGKHLNDRSAGGELSDVLRTSSYEEVRSTAAPSPAASHAGGASGDGARIQPGHTLRLQAAQVLEAIAVPPAFGSSVAELVSALSATAPMVDAERALFRACAAWQAGGDPEGHNPLLSEAFALLAGHDGRASLLPTPMAPRAVALALHGALIMPAKLEPLVLRKLAILIGREVPFDEPDPLRVACFIAGEVAHNRRRGLDFRLPSDGVAERALPWAAGGRP
jgi:hypothetical protein